MIILDTHVLVWWVSNPEKLSDKAQKLIEREAKKGNEILVSSISVWEICMLIKKNRLKLTMDTDTWIGKIEQITFLQFIPVDNKIAEQSVNLHGTFHNDPADRMIIATALNYGAVLITSDRKILNYPYVQSIW